MQVKSYPRFQQYTSDIKLPIVDVLQIRKTELWELIKHQRDSIEIARIQGKMDEIDTLIKYLTQ